MNWKERFLPLNVAEAGCLSFLIIILLFVVAYFLGFLNYIPYLAMGMWSIVYALRFGFQAQAAYQVPKRTALIVSGVLVLAYFFLWLGLVAFLNWGFQNFIGQINLGLFVIFGIVLAIAMYFHLVRFKYTVYEKWLGWQQKEGVADG